MTACRCRSERVRLLREIGPRMRSLQRARDNDVKMRERRARGQSYVNTAQDRKSMQEQLFPTKLNGLKVFSSRKTITYALLT